MTGGVARASYVWSPVYVDALVSRDRDADGSSASVNRRPRLDARSGDADHR